LDLLEVLYRLVPGSPPANFGAPRSGDIYRSVGSPVRAAALIGFRPEVSLEQGLQEAVAWMRA
jgi:nucleoside-diphosphate-sugar epimerase